jgi:serpin B
LTELSPHRVQVSLPKFRLACEMDLKDALSAMGMASLFQEGEADFSGITGTHDLWITALVHKTIIKVEEDGMEAAAATAVGTEARAVVIVPSPTVVFKADHPFFFEIHDVRTQIILFTGRMVRPQA